MGQYRDWVTQLTRNVNTTANRADDDAIAWLHKVFKQNTTFDEFYDCPMAFLTLDRKMAKALSEGCPKSCILYTSPTPRDYGDTRVSPLP